MFDILRRKKKSGLHFSMKGRYDVKHLRSGLLLAEYVVHNDITNIGKNTIFDTMFNSSLGITQIATWYIGLIDNNAFSALNSTDIMSSHAGWAEYTGYSGGVRPTWVSTATSNQTITNPTPATFNITTASANLYGIFIVSNNTLSGTTGVLWSTGPFSTVVPVVTGDQLKVTYTLNA